MTKFLLIFITFICIGSSCNTNESTKKFVHVDHDTLYQEITYTVQDSIEKISLEVYLSKMNKGVIRYRYKGDSALKDQITKLDSILYTILNDPLIDFNFTTLFWGRLNNTYNRDFTLARRLAMFANHSSHWNKKAGRPNSGHKNDFLKLLKNDFLIELGPLFKKFNYRIESISAEKVLVYPAEKLPFWNEIKADVNATDILPFDCQLWFTLSKIQ